MKRVRKGKGKYKKRKLIKRKLIGQNFIINENWKNPSEDYLENEIYTNEKIKDYVNLIFGEHYKPIFGKKHKVFLGWSKCFVIVKIPDIKKYFIYRKKK